MPKFFSDFTKIWLNRKKERPPNKSKQNLETENNTEILPYLKRKVVYTFPATLREKSGYLINCLNNKRVFCVVRNGILRFYNDNAKQIQQELVLHSCVSISVLSHNQFEIEDTRQDRRIYYLLAGSSDENIDEWNAALNANSAVVSELERYYEKQLCIGSDVFTYRITGERILELRLLRVDYNLNIIAVYQSHEKQTLLYELPFINIKEIHYGAILGDFSNENSSQSAVTNRCKGIEGYEASSDQSKGKVKGHIANLNKEEVISAKESFFYIEGVVRENTHLTIHMEMYDGILHTVVAPNESTLRLWFLGLRMILGKKSYFQNPEITLGTFLLKKIKWKLAFQAHSQKKTLRAFFIEKLLSLRSKNTSSLQNEQFEATSKIHKSSGSVQSENSSLQKATMYNNKLEIDERLDSHDSSFRTQLDEIRMIEKQFIFPSCTKELSSTSHTHPFLCKDALEMDEEPIHFAGPLSKASAINWPTNGDKVYGNEKTQSILLLPERDTSWANEFIDSNSLNNSISSLSKKSLNKKAEQVINCQTPMNEVSTFIASEKGDITRKVDSAALIPIIKKIVLEEINSTHRQLKEYIMNSLESIQQMRQEGMHKEIKMLQVQLQESEARRRKLQNEVGLLKGNVRIFVRVRPQPISIPSTCHSADTTQITVIFDEGDALFYRLSETSNIDAFGNPSLSILDSSVIEIKPSSTRNYIQSLRPFTEKNNSHRSRHYEFDNVFDMQKTQNDIFVESKNLIDSAVDGYHVSLLAYGQTGSGKTYSMLGNTTNEGLIFKSIDYLFLTLEDRCRFKEGAEYLVEFSAVEIYNESLIDLLLNNLNKEKSSANELSLKQNRNNNKLSIEVENLTQPSPTISEESLGISTDGFLKGQRVMQIKGAQELSSLLRRIQQVRKTTFTELNNNSSRSHLMIQISISLSLTLGIERVRYKGTILFGDLAGSENIKKSLVEGGGAKEAAHINLSLSALTNVVAKLVAKEDYIPYKDSLLTLLLKPSLMGTGKTILLVHVSPERENVHETINTLNFAEKARNIEKAPGKRQLSYY